MGRLAISLLILPGAHNPGYGPLILLSSSCWINISCLRWLELVRANACSSSTSLSMSILLRGTPAFSIAVTTFILYTQVELGKPSPTGWNSLSYLARAYTMSSSLFLTASFFLPFRCFYDFIWDSIELFLVGSSSLQARQNMFYLLTLKCSFG